MTRLTHGCSMHLWSFLEGGDVHGTWRNEPSAADIQIPCRNFTRAPKITSDPCPPPSISRRGVSYPNLTARPGFPRPVPMGVRVYRYCRRISRRPGWCWSTQRVGHTRTSRHVGRCRFNTTCTAAASSMISLTSPTRD